MLRHPLAHRQHGAGRRSSASARGTFGGGGGGGVPRRFSRIHLPRTTGEVRSGYEVTVRMLPCPSSPPRTLSGSERDAPEVAALDVRDAVVPRQPLVQERVVGASAGRARCGPRARCCRRTARSRAGTPGAGVVEVREDDLRPAPALGRLRRNSHCPAKFLTNASDRGSASIRRTCCASTAGILELPLRRERRAARRRECCSTGRTTAATPARDR